MFSGRTENYRHSFGKPPEVVLMPSENGSEVLYGLLLDISLQGAKVFSEAELDGGQGSIALKFQVHHEVIRTEARLVWKAPHAYGWTYGFSFRKDPVREMLLAKELASMKELS